MAVKSQANKELPKGMVARIARDAARVALKEFATTHAARESQLAALVKEAVTDTVPGAVMATLDRLGFDTSNPDANRKDMTHLRTWRETMEMIRDKGIGSLIMYVVAGILSLVVLGLGALFIRH